MRNTSLCPLTLQFPAHIPTHTLYTHHSTHMQGMYIMFHYLKGTPYVTGDQGDARRLTNWEQIDHGEQYTATRKFLIAVPIVL